MYNLINILTWLKKDLICFNSAIDKSMKTLAEINILNTLNDLKKAIDREFITKEDLFDCARRVGLII